MDNKSSCNNNTENFNTADAETNYLFSLNYCKHKSNERDQLDGAFSDFHVVKETNSKLLLPQYSEVLARSAKEGVRMEDLDTLQCDLEKLLSTCVVRKRLLVSRLNLREDKESIKSQRCEYSEKKCFPNKSLNEETLQTNLRNPNDSFIMKHNVPSTSTASHPSPTPVANTAHNNTANNFWSFTEPYFCDPTESDLAYIDELIQEAREDINFRKPEMSKRNPSRCPWFQQHCSNMHLPQMDNISTEGGFKRKLQDVPENDEISVEIENCLTELASVSSSNLTELLKLRAEVVQHLFSQQIE